MRRYGRSATRSVTEADVLAALERAMKAARLAGVPVVVAAIRPSTETRTASVMARGIGTYEDLTQLAAAALTECRKGVPLPERGQFVGAVSDLTEMVA